MGVFPPKARKVLPCVLMLIILKKNVNAVRECAYMCTHVLTIVASKALPKQNKIASWGAELHSFTCQPVYKTGRNCL